MTKRKLIYIILIALMLIYGCAPAADTQGPDTNTEIGLDPVDVLPRSDEFRLCADNEYLSLYVQPSSGAFYVLDKRSQTVWHSNPPGVEEDETIKGARKTNLQSQLLLSYVSKENNEEISNSHAGSRIKYGIKVAKREKGFRASYEFPDVKITVIVDVVLDGDKVTVSIPRDQVIEAGDYKLFSLIPYPFFGAGGAEDEGYVLVPDGSGALIYFNNNKQSLPEYKQRLYGADPSFSVVRQSAVTEQAFLPVFGIKRNDAGFLAVVEKGAEYATCRAYVSGQNGPYNGGYFDFQLRYSYQYSLDGINDIKLYDKKERVCGDISISYHILENDRSDYNGMAQRLRQYLVENGAREKGGANADVVLNVEGITTQRKYLLGFETRETVVLTQYRQAAAIVEELKAMGMEDIIIQYSGAVLDSYKGRVTGSLTPVSALGGAKDWAALTGMDGIVVAPEISFMKYYRSGNGVSTFFDAARNLSNALAKQQRYKPSTYYPDKEAQVGYLVSPGKLTSLARRFADKLNDNAAISLGDMGAVLYSDYNKSGRYSRTDALGSVTEILEMLQRGGAAVIAEKANMYALKYVDHITSVPVGSSRFSILDRDVPFYQLVVSGLAGYSSPSINLESSPEISFLKLLETGSVPQFTVYGNEDIDIIFTDTPEYFSCSFGTTRERIKDIWSEYSQAIGELGSSTIVSHRYLDDKVVQTFYSSGKSVIINYGSEDYSSPEANVPPMSYCIVGGEK